MQPSDGISFQQEQFASFFRDAQELFPQHYAELALDQDKVQLALDPKAYEDAEKRSVLFVFTARDNGELFGYYTAGLLPHLHYANAGTMASTDMYWVHPDYRRGMLGAKFLMAIEKALREKGVTKIYISCKAHHDLTKLFQALGYRLSDYMFTKLLT